MESDNTSDIVITSANKKRKYRNNLLNTSDRTTLITPKWFLIWVQSILGITFDFDPCPANRMLNGEIIDGLDENFSWGMVNFCNPPYKSERGQQNGIANFAEKFFREYTLSGGKKTCVFLVPARHTKYFHEYIVPILHTKILLPTNCISFTDENGDEYERAFPIPLAVYYCAAKDEKKAQSNKFINITNDRGKTSIAEINTY